VLGVEAPDLVAADAAGHDQHVVEVGAVGHRRHRDVDVAELERVSDVLVEARREVEPGRRRVVRRAERGRTPPAAR
jgi:hypothetical protein